MNKLAAERGYAVDATLRRVRDDIISGRYAPNSKLYPKLIAAEHGTSFIPVREALRVLESEGFVTFVNNSGTWVTPLTITDARDLYDTRIEIESQAVRRAEPFSSAEIDRLEDCLLQLRSANSTNDHDQVVEMNRAFHFALYQKSNSPRRLGLIELLWFHSERYQRMSLDHRHDAADAEHHAILDALRDGDHRAAGDALGAHLQTTIDLLAANFVEDAAGSEVSPSE